MEFSVDQNLIKSLRQKEGKVKKRSGKNDLKMDEMNVIYEIGFNEDFERCHLEIIQMQWGGLKQW